MKPAEFLLSPGEDGDMIIVDACQSAELRVIDFCAIGWNDGPALELFTSEDYQRTMDRIKGLPPEDQLCLDVYIANFSCIWDERRTQAVIPALLCKYADIGEKAFYFEIENGKRYLCSSMPQSQL